ncbi:MAG: NifU family protein [Firmicutes bacterium HGW-Firmicutes-12]|jgi:Fe-S cluster biogenesis protein NfuA|nr:MAG: NifU family protein [Firmicutes bacterium HGW-Firmicutes-12]
MFAAVEKVLEKEVRPYLKEHYGNVVLLGVNDGVVRIKLTGQCKHCPSAKFTVEDVIEKALKSNIEGITKVVLENEVSAELLDIARKILSKKDG